MTKACTDSLSELARRPLFEPLRDLLQALPGAAPPGICELHRLLRERHTRLLSGSGQPLTFVAAGGGLSYERRVFERGEIATRSGDWHDLFNALVWLTFPRAKAALNARHYDAMQLKRAALGSARCSVRDAATHFDECGVVVAAADRSLAQGLKEHAWKHVFWERRTEALERLRFFVFGHATYDMLRRPHRGLCAKALYMEVAQSWLQQDVATCCAALDAWLAGVFGNAAAVSKPQDVLPLPLLGIPGVVADNNDPAYYDDPYQFRPRALA